MKLFIGDKREQYIKSLQAFQRDEYVALGLTDAALLEIAGLKENGVSPMLLTADLDLAIAAEIRGYRVKNFNHLR